MERKKFPYSADYRPGKLKTIIFLAAAVVLVLVLAPFIGMKLIGWQSVAKPGSSYDILWQIRVPRVLLAFAAGASLASCGLVFQAMFRNVLATPYTLGVASGAAFGAALAMKFGLSFYWLGIGCVSIAALGGAMFSMLVVLALASPARGFSPIAMLLAGVVISYFFSSLVLLLQYLGDFSEVFQMTRWLMGALDVYGYQQLLAAAPLMLAGLSILFLLSGRLDLLMLGDEMALSRGLDAAKLRIALFFACSLVVAAVVSLCGPVGFVGLIVPYLCREVLRNAGHRFMLPCVFCAGGVFLVVCDTAARVVMAPFEVPVGVITALLGGPFFLWVLFKRRGRAGLYQSG